LKEVKFILISARIQSCTYYITKAEATIDDIMGVKSDKAVQHPNPDKK
jgi:hypothetical protein